MNPRRALKLEVTAHAERIAERRRSQLVIALTVVISLCVVAAIWWASGHEVTRG